jgi:ribose 1,5-bisphosphokinase PhnN
VFSDFNWAADTTTKRLQSGEVVMLNGGAISLTFKRRRAVAVFTIEAEYVVVRRAGQSAVHFRHLMQDDHQQERGATTVHEDNEGAVKLTNKPMVSKMTKHTHIKHQCIRELVDALTIAVVSLDSKLFGMWTNRIATGGEAHHDL